ncbi:hypothetical protein GCM10017600_89280 [Streptosporangium carneum]|uniref:Uncharacterized protein n=1 Tax=Streptosporangium carneum TaxID=47481 RepID=A0A9W6ID53_9ACTN|nr:hypothetical protein GCM10017600_89280 [Streptosporangium carneum]
MPSISLFESATGFHPFRPEAPLRPTFPIKGKDGSVSPDTRLCIAWYSPPSPTSQNGKFVATLGATYAPRRKHVLGRGI